MQKYDAIEAGIQNKDIKALREAIGSICYTSRDFSSGEFDEIVRYVESKGIRLKDESLIGNPTISSQKQSFTDEDFAKAIFELKKNFCHERIQDVKTIGKALYSTPKQVDVSDSVRKVTISGQNFGKLPNQESHQKNSNNVPMIVCLVAAIIVLIVVLLK